MASHRTDTARRIEKHPGNHEADLEIPFMCCDPCVTANGGMPNTRAVIGQHYYCGLCCSVWCIPAHVSRRNGLINTFGDGNIAKASANMIWLIILMGTLVFTIIVAGHFIVLWRISAREDTGLFLSITAAAIVGWIILAQVLAWLYTLFVNGVRWVYHYIRNEPMTEII